MTARSDSPVLHTAAKPAPLSLDSVLANSSSAAAAPSADSAAPKNLSQAETAAPRPNADVASQTNYSHDPSYHRLVGVLEYSRIQNAWTLRYASVEDEDRYGGSVTLEGLGPMTGFKNRQTVRVEGRLINPDSQQIRPAFEVEAIHRIGP